MAGRARWVPISGVLVAGGAGRRMGRDKATVPFDGEPLFGRAARILASVCDDVVVASGDGARLGWLGLPQVADPRRRRGPLGGLVAGLEAARHPLVAVLAGDMPFASPALLRLLASLVGSGVDVVVPVTGRGLEPLHAVYARATVSGLRRELEAGRLALREILGPEGPFEVRTVGEREWRAADPSGRFAVNVNNPEDLAPSAAGGR